MMPLSFYKVLKSIGWISLAFVLGLMMKVLVLGLYAIPSPSMEGSLLAGDVILVNKLRYGPVLPGSWKELPFGSLFFKSKKTILNNTHKRLKGYAAVQRNEVIIFKRRLYEKLLVKRCIGLPGEQILIRADSIFINKIVMPIVPTAILPPIAVGLGRVQQTNYNFNNTFPNTHRYRWSNSNFGPLIIPKKGQTISISPDNIDLYYEVIHHFEHKKVKIENGQVYINGQASNSYTFEANYYFVMGDNRSFSKDSRFFGFVPEKTIRGKALLVLWSTNPNSNQLRKNRFFEWIK